RRDVGCSGVGRDEIDLAHVELGAHGGQLLAVKVVLVCKSLQRRLVDRAALLGVVDEGLDRGRKRHRAQGGSLLRSGSWARSNFGLLAPHLFKRFGAGRYSPARHVRKSLYGPGPCVSS